MRSPAAAASSETRTTSAARASTSRGGLPARAGEERIAAHGAKHRVRPLQVDRRKRELRIAKNLGVDSAEADHDDRPEDGIVVDADDDFDVALDHWRDEHAVHAGVRQVPQRAAAERVELAAHVRFIRNADDNAADFGLVGDVG